MFPQPTPSLRYVNLNTAQQLEVYKLRQSCTHPAIPTIRIVARKRNALCIQVRLFERTLVGYMKLLTNQLITLQLLQQVVAAAIYIRSKFGCFAASENLIKIDGQGIPKLWIHQDPISIIRQIPLPNEKSGQRAMIKSILVIFKPFIRNYQHLIKLDTFDHLKNQLKKTISSYKTKRDTNRNLTMTASKALFFLKSSKNNVVAGTQRQNNTYSNHLTFNTSPRFSSISKDQDNRPHQSSIIIKNQQNQSFISSRKKLFQIMQLPKTTKKQITQQNSYQITINENEQNTIQQQWMSTIEFSMTNNLLKPYQLSNNKITLNMSRNTNLSNSLLQDQINNLFGEEQHSQFEFENNQNTSQEIEKDFNFIFN